MSTKNYSQTSRVYQNDSKYPAVQNFGCLFVCLLQIAYITRKEKLTVGAIDNWFDFFSKKPCKVWSMTKKKMIDSTAVKRSNCFIRNPDFILKTITKMNLNSVLRNEKPEKHLIATINEYKGNGYTHFALPNYDPWFKDGKGSQAVKDADILSQRLIIQDYYI